MRCDYFDEKEGQEKQWAELEDMCPNDPCYAIFSVSSYDGTNE